MSLHKYITVFLKVVVFTNEEERNQFVEQLIEFLSDFNIEQGIFPNIPEKELYKMAVTKEKRNAMLEKFFKTIFKEVGDEDFRCLWVPVTLCMLMSF